MALKVKGMYKIHALSTVEKYDGHRVTGSGNLVFYETEEDAVEAAEGYVRDNDGRDPMVIFKAHMVVSIPQKPVEVQYLDSQGLAGRPTKVR